MRFSITWISIFGFLWKIFLTMKKFFDQFFCRKLPCWKFRWLWKISFIKIFVENVLDCGKFLFCEKFPWSSFSWKISMINVFCWKFLWSKKIYLPEEKLFDQVNSMPNSFETIKIYIRNLGLKFSWLVFLW